jgi:hypothetical protein
VLFRFGYNQTTPIEKMITLVMKIFGLIFSRTMAGIMCVLLCFGLVYLLAAGPSKTTADSPQKTIQKLLPELERRNPEAAAELARMQETRDNVALAATLKERAQLRGLDGLVQLAQAHKNPENLHGIYDLRLAEIAVSRRFVNQQQRSDFILAHGIGLEQQYALFNGLGLPASQSPVNDYFRSLELAAQDDHLWSRVRENPVMLFLMQQNVDQELLDFYNDEKDWLDDVLFVVVCNANADEEGEPLMPQDVLQTIRKNHPVFKNALETFSSPESDGYESAACVIYALFANYGGMFRYCVKEGLMPVSELLEVVFANLDFFDKHADDAPENLAAKLITIRDSHPAVWQAAKQYPLCLELYDRIPHLADSLCENYVHDDIATFLFTKYDDNVPAAAAAIDKFGDLAVLMLTRHENSPVFREALKNNSLGVRIIPYVARFEDHGLARLDTNQEWLNKYFDEAGNAKEKEWWTQLPGGGAADVARNWANGYPNEWGELGWAALDVADAVLLVACLGASAPASAAKTGATTTAKVGSKVVAREVVENAAARRVAAAAGARTAAREGTASLFRRALARTGLLRGSRIAAGTARVVLVPIRAAVSTAGRMSSAVFANVRSIRVGWAGLAPTTRQAVCRGLLTVGLTVTIYYRTMPMLKEQLLKVSSIDADKIGRQLAGTTTELAKTAAGALAAFLDEMLRLAGVPGGGIRRYAVYVAGILFLGLGILYFGRRAFFRSVRVRATG